MFEGLHGAARSEAATARTTAASLIIPAITDDAVEGNSDRLGVDPDARALAALVASRQLEPPLAIGLYGEWGSGKTFFMKRVQAFIDDLTTNDTTDTFSGVIAPVWFSAWHYAEGNLWASLLHHIFASLHAGRSRHQLALDEVMTTVKGAEQLTSAAAAQVEVARTHINSSNRVINAAKERHREAIEKSSKLRKKDLWEAVKLTAADKKLIEPVVKAANDLGLSVASDSARDLAEASCQVIAIASRTRALATSRPLYRSPLAYAFYAAVIVGLVGLAVGMVVHRSNEWTGTAITAIGQLAAIGAAIAGWISRQASLARGFIAPAETLQRQLQERVARQRAETEWELARLDQEAGRAEAELTVAIQEHAAAKQRLEAVQKEQAELTGGRLLRRYLAERASSHDYEDYMGVVALAYRDLCDLDEHLRAAKRDSSRDDQRLDRIVLYIDDLDRCGPDVVAEVLDAVHLLLALRLFVVIVGVDPRWLDQSLRVRHPVLLEPESGTPSTTPSDYLEKIFQLTYTLPPMTGSKCADLLVAAAQNTQELSSSYAQQDGGGDDHENLTTNNPASLIDDRTAAGLAEALTLNEDEIKALREIAPLVSTSPRRAKRFLNIYLVTRARALGDPTLRTYFDRDKTVIDNALLVLIAILIGLPNTMAAAMRDMAHSDSIHTSDLASLLTRMSLPEEQARLREFLTSAEDSITKLSMEELMRWLSLARPYLPLSLAGLQFPI